MVKAKKQRNLESETSNKTEDPRTDIISDTVIESPPEPFEMDALVSNNYSTIEDSSPLISLIIKDYIGFDDGLLDGFGTVHYTEGHIYEGTFINGQMEGKGSIIWPDGVKYEGDFCANEITGNGKYSWPNNNVYEGQVMRGIRNGEGKFTYANGFCYFGGWLNGKKHGLGLLDNGSQSYDGMWTDLPHGYGIRKYSNGDSYEGYFIHGIRHGKGKMNWKTLKQTYFGDWQYNHQNGNGTHIWYLGNTRRLATHNKYIGGFLNAQKSGFGIFYYADGSVFEGQFLNDRKNGKGRITFKNGRNFEGDFCDDQLSNILLAPPDLVGEITGRVVHSKNPLPVVNSHVQNNDQINEIISVNFNIPILKELMGESFQTKTINSIVDVISRHLNYLEDVFHFYGLLGLSDHEDQTFICYRFQFWQLMKNCHFDDEKYSIADLTFALFSKSQKKSAMVDPSDTIIFQTFISYIVVLAQKIFSSKKLDAAKKLQLLIETKMMPNACQGGHRGLIFKNKKTAENVFQHFKKLSEIYKQDLLSNGSEFCTSREFLFFIKNLNLLKSDFSAIHVLSGMAQNDSFLVDSYKHYSLERTMTFLDFFECLVGFSQVYVTEEILSRSLSRALSASLKPGSGESLNSEDDFKSSNEQEGVEKEQMDNDMKYFNYWTHQLHFFFVNILYPAAETFSRIKKTARDL